MLRGFSFNRPVQQPGTNRTQGTSQAQGPARTRALFTDTSGNEIRQHGNGLNVHDRAGKVVASRDDYGTFKYTSQAGSLPGVGNLSGATYHPIDDQGRYFHGDGRVSTPSGRTVQGHLVFERRFVIDPSKAGPDKLIASWDQHSRRFVGTNNKPYIPVQDKQHQTRSKLLWGSSKHGQKIMRQPDEPKMPHIKYNDEHRLWSTRDGFLIDRDSGFGFPPRVNADRTGFVPNLNGLLRARGQDHEAPPTYVPPAPNMPPPAPYHPPALGPNPAPQPPPVPPGPVNHAALPPGAAPPVRGVGTPQNGQISNMDWINSRYLVDPF